MDMGKNNSCNGHYINVVKAIKWSHRFMRKDMKYPKGYPLEHMIGVCCPDSITSVAQGVTTNARKYRRSFYPGHSRRKDPILSKTTVYRLTSFEAAYQPADFKKFHEYCME